MLQLQHSAFILIHIIGSLRSASGNASPSRVIPPGWLEQCEPGDSIHLLQMRSPRAVSLRGAEAENLTAVEHATAMVDQSLSESKSDAALGLSDTLVDLDIRVNSTSDGSGAEDSQQTVRANSLLSEITGADGQLLRATETGSSSLNGTRSPPVNASLHHSTGGQGNQHLAATLVSFTRVHESQELTALDNASIGVSEDEELATNTSLNETAVVNVSQPVTAIANDTLPALPEKRRLSFMELVRLVAAVAAETTAAVGETPVQGARQQAADQPPVDPGPQASPYTPAVLGAAVGVVVGTAVALN